MAAGEIFRCGDDDVNMVVRLHCCDNSLRTENPRSSETLLVP